MAAHRAFWVLFCPGKSTSSSGRESLDVSDGPLSFQGQRAVGQDGRRPSRLAGTRRVTTWTVVMKGGKELPESPTLALTFALVARGSAYKLADSNNKRRNKSGREVLIASDWGGIPIINFHCVWAHCRSPRNKHQFTLAIIYEILRKLYCLIDIYFSRLRK